MLRFVSYFSTVLLLALIVAVSSIQYELETQSGLKVESGVTPTCKAPSGPLYLPDNDACVQPQAQTFQRQQREIVADSNTLTFPYVLMLAYRCCINLLIIAAGVGLSMACKRFQGDCGDACVAGWRDLAVAVQAGNTKKCKSLLAAGAKANDVDPWGRTALHHAAAAGFLSVAELILTTAGAASVDSADGSKETPLHAAARAGHSAICDLLLSFGAQVDAVNDEGHTPLFLAAKANKEEACELLLAKGGGTPGVADSDLPLLLSKLLVQRVFGNCDWPNIPLSDDLKEYDGWSDDGISNGGD